MEKWIEGRENYKHLYERRRGPRRQFTRTEDPRTTGDLIRLALGELDEDIRWQLVASLPWRDDVIARVDELSRSRDANERVLAAEILGQNARRSKTANDFVVTTLLRMIDGEADVDVLYSIAIAFGNTNDPRAVAPLLPLVNHPESYVRFGVVHGISGLEDERAIAALIKLSADEDTDVRDWATFGLGSQIDADTREIRKALLARTADADEETRGEALVGLANRGDRRVVEPLLHELEAAGNNPSRLVCEAVIEAGARIYDLRLFPWLRHLEKNVTHHYMDEELGEAIDRLAKASTKPLWG